MHRNLGRAMPCDPVGGGAYEFRTNAPGAGHPALSQVVTLAKEALPERLGRIDSATMRRVEAGLRRALDLA